MTRLMKTALIIAYALCLAGVARAQTPPNLTITWAPQLKYTDGSTLLATDIAAYDVVCRFTPTGGTVAGACSLSKTALVGGTATTDSLTATIPAAGGALCVKLTTRLKSGAVSAESGESCKTYDPLSPMPPTGVRVVQIDVRLLRLERREIALGDIVGSAILGSPCGRVDVVAGYRSVARSNVRLRIRQPDGVVLVAKCG